MGARPTPTAIKMLRGSFKKDPQRQNLQEPEYPDGRPRCPAHLNGIARARWEHMCKMLEAMKLQTPANMAGLEVYCQAYAQWREAIKDPDKPSNWQIIKHNNDLMLRILMQFGFTPSARTSIHVNPSNSVKQVMRRERS